MPSPIVSDLISPADLVFLKTACAGWIAYGAHRILSEVLKPAVTPLFPQPKSFSKENLAGHENGSAPLITRSVSKILSLSGHRCIVFFGSQTGTAEKLALIFAKDLRAKHGLQSVVANMDDYDYDDFLSNQISTNTLAVFLLATYGEGEPTNSAVGFNNFLLKLAVGNLGCQTLNFAIFGLGDSSYQRYNAMAMKADTTLAGAGGHRIGRLGLGDDGTGQLQDSFLSWKDNIFPLIASHFAVKEKAFEFEPLFDVNESSPVGTGMAGIFRGEPNRAHLIGKMRGPYTENNPFLAPIKNYRELFAPSSDRRCMHIEFDIGQSTISYETGDHLSVRPANPNLEVDRFLRVFGLDRKKGVVIEVTKLDFTILPPVPKRTTYESAVKFYLDVCGPVSRGFLLTLSEFLTNDQPAKAVLRELGTDAVRFREHVTGHHLNLAQLLETVDPSSNAWVNIPFCLLLENIGKLRPRYYSISSSSRATKKSISITSVVERRKEVHWSYLFNGVATNFLSSTVASGNQVYISVRRSKFRLPSNPSTPVIMIGPGTGVAPFRAFIQERAMQSREGAAVGKTMLFYGCRRRDEDFLYDEEWKELAISFGTGVFSIDTAFSRDPEISKTYVQDLLQRRVAELRDLVLNCDAHVYVCGDAKRMAKDVFATMGKLMCEDGSGANYITQMKKEGRWLEDVW